MKYRRMYKCKLIYERNCKIQILLIFLIIFDYLYVNISLSVCQYMPIDK